MGGASRHPSGNLASGFLLLWSAWTTCKCALFYHHDCYCLAGTWRWSESNIILACWARERKLFKSTPELTVFPQKKKIREMVLIDYKTNVRHISRKTMVFECCVLLFDTFSERSNNGEYSLWTLYHLLVPNSWTFFLTSSKERRIYKSIFIIKRSYNKWFIDIRNDDKQIILILVPFKIMLSVPLLMIVKRF